MDQRTTRPGFGAGFRALLSGARFVLTTPRSWPYALVPGAVLILLSGVLGWGAIRLVQSALDGWLGQPTSTLGQWGVGALAWLGYVLAALLGLLAALALAPPLSSPALERIVELYERQLGAPERAPMSLLSEIWCGFRAQALAALLVVPIVSLLWVIELLVSPAVFVTVPLKFLVTALGLAWNLFDYPLTLRGVKMRDRLRLLGRNKRAALGFGIGFSILFWLPCFGVLMLPVGVAAATRLLWRILDAEPELLPGVGRPAAPAASPDAGAIPAPPHSGDPG